MQINFTGQGMEVTEALRSIVNDKFKTIEHHFNHITHVNVIFKLERERVSHIAEINVHANGTEFNAHGISDNLYKAVDLMIHKLEKQMQKHKDKSRGE